MRDDEREGKYPYVWGVDSKNRLMRVLVSKELVRSTQERRRFWRQLKSLVGLDQVVDLDAVRAEAKAEMAQKLTASLFALATGGNIGALADFALPGRGAAAGGNGGAAALGDWEPAWIDTPQCTACDECTQINPKIFVYNAQKQATVADPKGGPYRDIVQGGGEVHGGLHPPGHAVESRREGPRQAREAGGEVPVSRLTRGLAVQCRE